MSGSILFEAIVFLAGALICVPLAKRLGLSSVLGYLLAGILIGPYVLGFVGEDILHFAEFGVVMMLFLIGLEIEPKNFWNMRKTILGMGGAQVLGSMIVAFLLFYYPLGFSNEVSLTFSMAVALSSTAITLQTLKEKDLFETTYGASSFSILLFQDIIVIFMLGMLPLLSNTEVTEGEMEGQAEHAANLLDNLPLGQQTLAIIISVALIVVAGRYLFVPMLRKIATIRVRELLTAAALLIVFGISLLMELVGLSPALGAFLGGVVLATSEFKHELESTLEPFKDLLLGLFFIAVGASINFIVIKENPWGIGGLLMAIIVLKAVVLYGVGTLFKLKMDQRLLLTVGLAQIGEFAFVLLSFAFQLEIVSRVEMDTMLVVTALTMALTPILAMLNERLVLPRVGTKETEKRAIDHIAKQHKVILVGFGHFGSTVGRFLRSHGIEATILDFDSNRVDFLRKMGFEVHYGDATRMDLLESAGIADAKMLISALDHPSTTQKLVEMVKKKYPNLELLVRAKNRYEAFDLLELGVDNIYRESLDTSVKMASDALSKLGFRKYTLYRQAQNFIKLDEEGLRELAKNRPEDEKEYIFKAREAIAQQEKVLEQDWKRGIYQNDNHWDSEQMRLAREAGRNNSNLS
ncbi:monovalent cation:proton antiporter-2 (CPA2) family protein [Cytophaga sp. FL35]|uniref:monovalent cation:proton antiporter-2 (CPA2) family protein n=1 Tax=Cytophaga sp. FL35 TaxID=1904456 RepID=UPI00165362F5|nr:monovalent cation:proton antiporter-2 (CPA2) family protein [Cytophaga sp. FL35]MBC6999412.1 cation:proton antiporter [Cytophaga sp. FL35]